MDTDIPLLAVGVRAVIFIFSFLAIGFFAGSETAFLGMDLWAIDGLASLDNRRAKTLKSLLESRETTISAVLVGTNIFTVLASVMGVSMARLLGLGGSAVMVLIPLSITVLVFLFSELVPKSYASQMPTEKALAVSYILAFAVRLLKPLAQVFAGLPTLFTKSIAPKVDVIPSVADGAVRAAVDLAGGSSDSSEDDSHVIYGVLDSSDTRLGEIMVPLSKAITFVPSTTLEEALDGFRRHRFSRVPVLDEKTGQVPGVVYMKDVVREIIQAENLGDSGVAATSTVPGAHMDIAGGSALDPVAAVAVTTLEKQMGVVDGSPEVIAARSTKTGSGADSRASVMKVARKPFFADIGQNVLDLLAKMRKNRVHFAVVVQRGKPVGIVTIEDLIEEILGDIPEDSVASVRQYAGFGPEDDLSTDMALGCGDVGD
ncbi:MAG: CNNM domain-containing protein [Bacillota bacterium]|jgi:CBS domain containing-hemolysin-like protein